MFNAEKFVQSLTARELSELRALLNSEEYLRMIEDWEDSFNSTEEDN